MAKKKVAPRSLTPEELGEALRAIQLASLEKMRAAYQKGAKLKLLEAAAWCGKCGLKLPEWVTAGLISAHEKYTTYEVKTLDEAFGIPSRRTGLHTKPRHEFFKRSFEAYSAAIHALTLRGGRGVGDDFFEEVGEGLQPPISGKKVKAYYYHWKDILPQSKKR